LTEKFLKCSINIMSSRNEKFNLSIGTADNFSD